VPAAAVIPAPIAYIKVAAVKKLVVGFQSNLSGPLIKGLLVEIHSASLNCASDEHLFSFPGGYSD